MSLSVEDGNHAARALYTRHGFSVVGRNGGSDTMLRELFQSLSRTPDQPNHGHLGVRVNLARPVRAERSLPARRMHTRTAASG